MYKNIPQAEQDEEVRASLEIFADIIVAFLVEQMKKGEEAGKPSSAIDNESWFVGTRTKE